ncbi:MAG: EF-hand domain-containing protein [Formosimonas sp.]
MYKIIYGLAVVVLASVNSAQAKTDANNDGVFTRDEMVAAAVATAEKKFTKVDANHDGKVTLDELAGQKRSIAKAADANKDGVITMAEVKTRIEQGIDKRLAKKDLNKDGKLSKEERQRKQI